ncbi:MAG: hypothetical protein AAFX06_11115 [Planctomycetota bacterium]
MNDESLLTHLLTEEGCSLEEIDQILRKLQEHDQRTVRESVFDSIEAGRFDLQSLIQEFREESES